MIPQGHSGTSPQLPTEMWSHNPSNVIAHLWSCIISSETFLSSPTIFKHIPSSYSPLIYLVYLLSPPLPHKQKYFLPKLLLSMAFLSAGQYHQTLRNRKWWHHVAPYWQNAPLYFRFPAGGLPKTCCPPVCLEPGSTVCCSCGHVLWQVQCCPRCISQGWVRRVHLHKSRDTHPLCLGLALKRCLQMGLLLL